MAHTIEDLVRDIADEYSSAEKTKMSNCTYNLNKAMLWKLLEELHNPMYLEKFLKPNYKDL